MTEYRSPMDAYRFMIMQAGLGQDLQKYPACRDLDVDDMMAILQEAASFCDEVVAPTLREGDEAGVKLENGKVRLPQSFLDAFEKFNQAGWLGLSLDPEYGGQGLPWALCALVQEMLQGANMTFSLNPLLTLGAADSITNHGTKAQALRYVVPMVEGRWSGTMNLTEPQAGSDLALIKSKAFFSHEDEHGRHYRLHGQKIFITYGDHEAHENIVHLVLARIEGAPEGIAGISLFIVPKYLVNDDGSLGARNDLKPVALEKKLGIHASPTCVMSYGDNEGAHATLLGQEHHGVKLMFTMMNVARLMVGLQGLGISERAFQQAKNYALTRIQGKNAQGESVAIIKHGDVKRMIVLMEARIYAMRALVKDVMLAFDTSRVPQNESWGAFAKRRLDLMVPVVKAWNTDNAVLITSSAVQVHGGAGFIEDTGIAQLYRDARILPIYEGTNGIQAQDLIGRKIIRDEGKAFHEYIEEAHSLINRMNQMEGDDVAVIRKYLANGIDQLEIAVEHILTLAANANLETYDRLNGMAVDFNQLFGIVAAGISLTNMSLNALGGERGGAMGNDAGGDEKSLTGETRRCLLVNRAYAENILPEVAMLATRLIDGGNSFLKLDYH